MAVSIEELIDKKDEITKKKKQLYDLDTNIGRITIKPPTRSFIADIVDLEDPDTYLIYNSVIVPKLSDKTLLKAYECKEPTDIVGKLFPPGEISAIARKILECAGYQKDIHAELSKEIKN